MRCLQIDVEMPNVAILNVLIANYELKHKTGYPELDQILQFERVCSSRFSNILMCKPKMQVRTRCKQITFIYALHSTNLSLIRCH